jgi:hypothetical protein
VTYFQTTLKKDSMKSLLTSASMITVGVFVFFACQKSSIPPKEGFRDCYTCKQDEFYGLTVDEFMEGVARYKNTHANLVNADPYMMSNKLEASRSCWYSIDTLKKFICLIEQYSKKVDVKPEDLGIRFYYAVYPSTGPVLNGSNYKSLHTLFMVPTVTGADSIPVDFDPRYSAGVRDGGKEDAQDTGKRDTKQSPKDPKAKYYTITQLDKNVKLLMLESETAASATTTSMAKNQGQLCPPTCNGSTSNTLQQADASHPGVKYN